MSDNHQTFLSAGNCSQQEITLAPPSAGEVQHANCLSKHIGALYLSENYSDITLIVDGCRLPAHKVILAARSDYFRALLYGGLRESGQDEIELKQTGLAPFKILLRYVYTGQLGLQQLRDDLLLDLLGLTHKYGFDHLVSAIIDYLKQILTVQNLCQILGAAQMYCLDQLTDFCLQFADRNADTVLSSDTFCSLPAPSVIQLISRDSFCAKEIDIFLTLQKWAAQNLLADQQDLENILSHIRLQLIKLDELLQIVRPSGLVPADVILDAIKEQTEKPCIDLPYRGFSLPDVNVARTDLHAQVIEGEIKQALLNGDNTNYDMERGFSRHPIDNRCEGIIVQLGAPYIINHIRLLLWDRDQRSYSYYIEASVDRQDWVRIVDNSRFFCRSWQRLCFTPRVVRYIRIVGTHNTVNRVFHLVSMEAMFSTESFQLDPETGVVQPNGNVATVERSACVVEGVSRSRNALVNGDTNPRYDWDSGYTCHQIGSGSIVVQLAQPFLIGSARLLLWDCDDRRYSYVVETSVDQRQWQVAVDRSRDNCRSWQTLRFAPRVASFFRITGTRNTANEVFHAVTFQCPANAETDMDDALTNEIDVGEEDQAGTSN